MIVDDVSCRLFLEELDKEISSFTNAECHDEYVMSLLFLRERFLVLFKGFD